MKTANRLFATFSTDSAAIRAGVNITGYDKAARRGYLLTIWLILALAFSGAFSLAPNHPSKAKAEASMPQLQGEEAISYLKSQSLLASLQNEFGKITAPDGEAEDSFGQSVAISGDTAIIGASRDNVGNNFNQGSAYIFGRNEGGPNNWGLVRKITASDGGGGDAFGDSVAISGDTIVVGSPSAQVGNNLGQGAAYVFERSAGGPNNWGETRKLLASDGAAQDRFGDSAGVSGDTLIIGAPQHSVGNKAFQGAAYVFERNQGGPNNWGEIKKLLSSDGVSGDQFGSSAAISGNTLVVGAPQHSVGNEAFRGAAYIFERNQGGADFWGEVKQLLASDGAQNDQFGFSVAMSGDALIVGARSDMVGSNVTQGSAYIFERNQGGINNWGETRKLTASDGTTSDFFGSSVAISGDTAVVGSLFDNVGNNADQGSAYLFERNQGGPNNWGEVRQLLASDGAANDAFGNSVGVSGDTAIVGAFRDDVGINSDQGSAYIFNNPPAPTFDLCLQDDSARSRQLVFNSLTGDYVFCDNSTTIGGVAVITRKGNTITLNHMTTGYRLLASVSLDTRRGSASMRIFASGAVFTITDRNTSNNTCSCGAP